jgi:hypothetical protein
MNTFTRRRFLGWTGAGAAGAGLLAFAPRLLPARASEILGTEPAAAGAAEGVSSDPAQPLVAYIHNPASGDLSLMLGMHEVTVHDPDLVSRLIRGAVGQR